MWFEKFGSYSMAYYSNGIITNLSPCRTPSKGEETAYSLFFYKTHKQIQRYNRK